MWGAVGGFRLRNTGLGVESPPFSFWGFPYGFCVPQTAYPSLATLSVPWMSPGKPGEARRKREGGLRGLDVEGLSGMQKLHSDLCCHGSMSNKS